MSNEATIDPTIPPSSTGCVDCLATPDDWWSPLRRCVQCGHIGCCDTSPLQHACKHVIAAGHPIIHSFEPDEDWFYDYVRYECLEGPAQAPPPHHSLNQPVPGPVGRVPLAWERHLH